MASSPPSGPPSDRPSGPRPKGDVATVDFGFSALVKFLKEKPNINNMPAHAWNTATHAQQALPLLPTVSTGPAGPTSSMSASQAPSQLITPGLDIPKQSQSATPPLRRAPMQAFVMLPSPFTVTTPPSLVTPQGIHSAPTDEAGPTISMSVSQAPSQMISPGLHISKRKRSETPSLPSAPLQPFLTPASHLPVNPRRSLVTPQVIHSAPKKRAAPDTAASSPLSSAPPLPTGPPPQTSLIAESAPPKIGSWTSPASPGQFSNFAKSAQVTTDDNIGAGANPLSTFFPPISRSFETTGTLSANPPAQMIFRAPIVNGQRGPAPAFQPASTPSMQVLDALRMHGRPPIPHGVDPYKIELDFRTLATQFPTGFETLVGLYLQQSGRTPAQIGQNLAYILSCRNWELDLRRKDTLDANPQAAVERWIVPNDPLFLAIAADADYYAGPFEASIRWFATQVDRSGFRMEHIIRKAGWTTWIETSDSQAFKVMHNIFAMEETEENNQKLAQARRESPLFFEYCLKDPFCGTAGRFTTKRKRDDLDLQVIISYTPRGRKELEVEQKVKRIKMAAARPMQVHNVPLEERAFDSKGNRLPWALEWPEGHPNARGQKRHVEEKGPFGKSNKRKGSSRTRTATPAKKENPTLDSFEKALSYDLKKQAESPTDATTPSRTQSDTPSSVNKEPTQVLLYGYPTSRQWQAIDTYEKIGGGIICEDYERQPDMSLRRYPNPLSSAPRAHMKRPLTRAEKVLAFQYAGGANWVKVTFDSAEAAERAVESSPIQVQQHWVYAQLYYTGIAPQQDAPIESTPEERALGRPLTKYNQIYGPSSIQQVGAVQGGLFAAAPNSTLNTSTPTSPNQPQEPVSLTSSTASSGTATGTDASNLRPRTTAQPQQAANPRMMRHFPDIPRTILRPAHEALLPQPTFWERQFQWLADHGLMPGEIIGNGVPVLDNGDIDWQRASFYWKFFYWVDSTFGTDYCGLRNDD